MNMDDFAPYTEGNSGSSRGARGGAAGGRRRVPHASGAAAAAAAPAARPASRCAAGRAPPKKKTEKEYVPDKKTGAFAILGQLWLFEQQGHPAPDIKTLKSAATRFSNDPMHKMPGSFYCAWNGMSTLEGRSLVDRGKRGGRHTIMLTPEGRELAEKLVLGNAAIFGWDGNSNSNSNGLNNSSSVNDGNISPPSNLSAPRRTGATAAAASTASSSSSPAVHNGGAFGALARRGGGGGCGGGGSRINTARAAEARRSEEIHSKNAEAAAVAAGIGTKRARNLQHIGTKKHEKKSKLHDRGEVASPLLAALSQSGQTNRNMSLSKETESAAPPAAAAAAAGNKFERSGSGGGGDDLGVIDDDWMRLTSRPTRSPMVISASSPPPRNSCRPIRINNPYSKTTLGSSGSTSGGPARRRAAASSSLPPVLPLPVPAESERQRGGTDAGTNIGRGGSAAAAASSAAAVIGDVVDISLSDDEDEQVGNGDDRGVGGGGGGRGTMMTPPPNRARPVPGGGCNEGSASSLSSGRPVHDAAALRQGGGGGGDGGGGGGEVETGTGGAAAAAAATVDGGSGGGAKARAPGPGGRGVVPVVSPTYFRSMARGAGVPVGSCESGAMNWRGRGCPAWLQREMDIGALCAADRMSSVFDLVLIVDVNDKKEVEAPVRAELERFLSQRSLRRAGVAVVPPTGIGLEMQVARLQVGDFAWAWRRKRRGVRGTAIDAEAAEEVLLVDCVVERKGDNHEDIIHSVEGKDKRYKGQKRRMRLSGLSRLIYLLEGTGQMKGKTREDRSETIRTVEAKTLAEGFVFKRVRTVQESAAFLLSLSLQLMGTQGAETVEQFLANPSRPKVTFREWDAAMHRTQFEPPAVTLEFAKSLSTVTGIGPEGARVIARHLRSPRSFFNSLRQCSTPDEQRSLVEDLKLSDGGKKASTRKIGPTVADRLVKLFADKSQST
ncbi:unnamed protein product [Pylaiella littoralis]